MRIILFLVLLNMIAPSPDDFKQNQLSYLRVKNAYEEKQSSIKTHLKKLNLQLDSLHIYLRAFKNEKVLELWGKNISDQQFQLINTYPFCSSSGTLGPKRNQGDFQIPEGLYHIDRFNPQSNFLLSLGINYPNKADVKHGGADPGGDIFIHGDCVTIGCIPITDDKIKEVYLYAVEAKNNGQQNIPVHIFPFKTIPENWNEYEVWNAGNSHLIPFWKSLNPFQEYFDKNRQLKKFTITAAGEYEAQ